MKGKRRCLSNDDDDVVKYIQKRNRWGLALSAVQVEQPQPNPGYNSTSKTPNIHQSDLPHHLPSTHDKPPSNPTQIKGHTAVSKVYIEIPLS